MMNMMSMDVGVTLYRIESGQLVNASHIEMIEEIAEKGKLHPTGYVLHMSSGNPIYITLKDYNKIISDIGVK